MGEIVSKAKFSIDYSGGNFALKRVKSCDVKFDEDLEVVLAVGVDGGAGYREKNGGGELTLEVYPETMDPEVDYWAVQRSRERFAFVIQDLDGVREQYRGCRVASRPGRKIDEQGNMMNTVTVKFLTAGRL